MLTGSRIITCHVTMEHTPPLPSGFNINGYLIRSLKQTDSLCHVYYASDANHVQYLLREFCPQGLAVRDPESGKLRYPENTDIEREVLPLKNDFEAQFRTGSLGKSPLWAPCTWLMPFPAAMPPRSRLPARPPLRHPSSSAISGPWPLPEPPGRRPFMRAPFPSCGKKEELRRHMDSHPAPAGRSMRNLLFHPEPRGKTRLCSGAGRSPTPTGKRKPPRPP